MTILLSCDSNTVLGDGDKVSYDSNTISGCGDTVSCNINTVYQELNSAKTAPDSKIVILEINGYDWKIQCKNGLRNYSL